MTAIAIYLTIVLVGYMVLTDRLVGTTYSISNSWYAWKKRNYSSAFIIFLACISLGLFLVVNFYQAKHDAFYLLLIGGAFTNFCIGIAANFKQTWRDSMYHNIFSVATFLAVHMAFYIEGVKFPLESFLLLSVVFNLIDIDKKTTVVEVIGIGLAIMGVYYLGSNAG